MSELTALGKHEKGNSIESIKDSKNKEPKRHVEGEGVRVVLRKQALWASLRLTLLFCFLRPRVELCWLPDLWIPYITLIFQVTA